MDLPGHRLVRPRAADKEKVRASSTPAAFIDPAATNSLLLTGPARSPIAVGRRTGRSVSAPKERYVLPFYLAMMRTNAVDSGAELVPAILEICRSATAADVVRLLSGAWRPRVMGAWLAVLQDDPKVRASLPESLRTSGGSLTSPPLATAAALTVGPEAIGSLEQYIAADVAAGWGGAGFAAAAVELLRHTGGEMVTHPLATTQDRTALVAMLGVAQQLRDS